MKTVLMSLVLMVLASPAFSQAQSRIPTPDAPSCSTIRNVEDRLLCIEKRVDEMTDMLAKGFMLADTGNVSNNQCIGLQTNTTTSPIMVPCSPDALKTWVIKKIQ